MYRIESIVTLPTYDYIKKLPKQMEYEFRICDIIPGIYIRMMYNEDNKRKISLDIIINGYCDYSFYSESGFTTNHLYNTTKRNCIGLCKLLAEIKSKIYNNLEMKDVTVYGQNLSQDENT